VKSDVRNRLVLPLAIPIGAAVAILLVTFGFSRILLSVSHHAATAVALIVASSVLAACAVAATRARIRTGTIGAMLGSIAGVAMFAGGIAIVAIGPAKPKEQPFAASIEAPKGAAASGFASKQLTFAAARPVDLTFDNEDTGIQHNVVIVNGTDTSAPKLFTGQPVTGTAKFTYQVPPIKAGTYFFFCEFHPTTMTGTLSVTQGGANASVVAKDIAFDVKEIDLPAGAPTAIAFDNQDAGTTHNIGIYQDKSYSTELFKGTIITGPSSTVYHVDALDPGTYYFKCDIHSTMTGTVVVGGGKGGGGPSPPPSGPTPTKTQPPPTGGGGTANASISALGTAFSTTTLSLPADKTISLAFDNQDPGLQHNVAIYADSGYTQPLFTGAIVTGPTNTTYSISPLKPGTYYFRCDVHPTEMTGTVTVT
jgi:plastocyanin